jgi:cell surface protein SprA
MFLLNFRNVPIPNWNIKYNGLMRFDMFKRNFRRFSLQHNYRASYTINQYRSNFEFDNTPNGLDAGGNFSIKQSCLISI